MSRARKNTYHNDFPPLSVITLEKPKNKRGRNVELGLRMPDSVLQSIPSFDSSAETVDSSPEQMLPKRLGGIHNMKAREGSAKDPSGLKIQTDFDFSKRSRKEKEQNPENRRQRHIGYYQFKFLSQTQKLEVMKDLPKDKLKEFFSREYLEKLLNRLNSDIKDKRRFVKQFKFSFGFNTEGNKIEIRSKNLKELFNSPDFVLACQRLTIDSLTARKEVKIPTVNKMKSITRKMAVREKLAKRPLYEANLRLNRPCHYSNYQPLTRNNY